MDYIAVTKNGSGQSLPLESRQPPADEARHILNLHMSTEEEQTHRVEAVGVVVIVFGPLLAVLLLLLKAIRKLLPQPVESRPWQRRPDEPPEGGDASGDREPRNPLTPARSGAVKLELPMAQASEFDPELPRRTDSGSGNPGHRLAG